MIFLLLSLAYMLLASDGMPGMYEGGFFHDTLHEVRHAIGTSCH